MKEENDVQSAYQEETQQLIKTAVNFANEVLSSGYSAKILAEPFFRSGNKVKLIITSRKKRFSAMTKVIKELQNEKMRTLAVVGRTLNDSKKIFDSLIESGLKPTLIDSNQEIYKGGLSVIPIYLTKGLEFDAVIIADVDASNYEQNEQDAKLLYVGCTRALHQLVMFCTDEISPLIKDIDSSFYTTSIEK